MTLSRRHALLAGAATGLAAVSPSARAQGLRALTLQAAWINDAEFMGYYVAMEKGWYQAEGLDLKYLPGGPDVIPEASVLSRKADVALSTVETVINAVTTQRAPLVIIGAQYQKNPIGIVSLASKPIRTPADMIGKTIAVPPVNRLTVEAMLKLNGIDKSRVRIVPYAYDPTPLLKGEIDASLDFTTNVPYTIKSKGQDAVSFLLADFKLPLFNDVVVVTRDTLARRRADLVGFLRASRKGWDENFKDPAAYPPKYMETWFKGTGRSLDNEIYFNRAQAALMQHPKGVFALTPEAIQGCIDALNEVGIKAAQEHFDTSLLAEI
jgi:ABC-type nitrate/sulfonate/bicarbonate transport system substrate-binding protein